jgi:hypothetical protein
MGQAEAPPRAAREDGEVIEARKVISVDVAPLDAGTGSNRDWKQLHGTLKRALEACATRDAMREWETAWKDELDTMPEDYWADLKGVYDRRFETLAAVEA